MESNLLFVLLNEKAVALLLWAVIVSLIGCFVLLFNQYLSIAELRDENMKLYGMIEAQKKRIEKAESKLGYGRPRIETDRPVNGRF